MTPSDSPVLRPASPCCDFVQANRVLKQIVDTALPHWTTPSSAAAVGI
jgi:hypothetical protein